MKNTLETLLKDPKFMVKLLKQKTVEDIKTLFASKGI